MQCAIPEMATVAPSEIQPGRLVTWDEQVVRSALQEEVSRHCCWGSRVANAMQITSLDQTSSYYLKVTSFVESRDMNSRTQPYRGDFVDGPQNGQAPSLWQMQATRPALFETKHYETPVPHTEEVFTCSNCAGVGRCSCPACAGVGTVKCHTCTGSGQESCSSCSGRGVESHVNADHRWDPNAICDGKRAEDRVQWLIKEEGLTKHAAMVKVKQQFPVAFGASDWWKPGAICDGKSAEDRARWLMDNEKLSFENAKVKVRSEFPSIFGGGARELRRSSSIEGWMSNADCDGTTAQERAKWLVDNEGLTMSQARMRVKQEFPHAFGKREWDPNVLCEGTPAVERVNWLVENNGMTKEKAKSQVMDEFPSAFPTRQESFIGDASRESAWDPYDDRHCHHCVGKGLQTCRTCSGRTILDCTTCVATGVIPCPTCDTHGKVKTGLVLHVDWKNLSVDNALNGQGSSLSADQVKSAQGPQSEIQGCPVHATTQFPPAVNQASELLCSQAHAHQQKGLVHMQRMLVKQVPVCKVTATHNGTTFQFQIFGEDRNVDATEYPSKCCCGCVIT